MIANELNRLPQIGLERRVRHKRGRLAARDLQNIGVAQNIPDKVSTKLSELLPQVVDKLTPNGKIQQGDIASQGMELLKGLLK